MGTAPYEPWLTCATVGSSGQRARTSGQSSPHSGLASTSDVVEGSAGMMATLWSTDSQPSTGSWPAAGRRRALVAVAAVRRTDLGRAALVAARGPAWQPPPRPPPSRPTTRAGSPTSATPARWWSSRRRDWSSSRAVLRTWERDPAAAAGSWSASRCRPGWGATASSSRTGGGRTPGTSPAGTFAVVSAFGNGPDPGTALRLPGGRPQRLVDLRPAGPEDLQRAPAPPGGHRALAAGAGPRTCRATARSTGTRQCSASTCRPACTGRRTASGWPTSPRTPGWAAGSSCT